MLFGAGFLGLLTHFGATPLQVFIALPIALAALALILRMPARVAHPCALSGGGGRDTGRLPRQ